MNRTFALTLMLVVGCVAGAATAQLVVPKARAGTNPTRWEYHCAQSRIVEGSNAAMNAFGAEGWELVTTYVRDSAYSAEWMCFKRPLS